MSRENKRLVGSLVSNFLIAAILLNPFVLGGITVVQIKRKSFAPMGIDANARYERSDNYYLDVARPGTNRTD